MLLNSAKQTKSKLYSWGHWFSLANAMIALTISSIYWFAEPLPTSLLGLLYLTVYTLGHIPFLFFVGYLIFVFPITLINKPSIARPWAAFFGSIGLTLMFIDALVFSAHGYHINLLSLEYIQTDFQLLTASLPSGFIAAGILIFVAILFVELILANALWRDLEKYRRWFIKARIIPAAIVCFLMGHLTHIWADLSVYNPIIKQDKLLPLSYPLTAKTILSNSGLVDLNKYQQRKTFNFDLSNYQIDQPQQEMSCQYANDSITLNIMSLPDTLMPELTESIADSNADNSTTPNSAYSKHWSPHTLDSAVTEIFTGLPAIYAQTDFQPNLLDKALLSSYTGLILDNQTGLMLPEFLSQNKNSSVKLTITINAFNTLESVNQQLNNTVGDVIHLVLPEASSTYGLLIMTNQTEALPAITTHFDILPTLTKGWLQCEKTLSSIRFGRNLYTSTNQPAWFVTANEEAMYVWNKQSNTKIEGNAQMKSINLETGEVVEPPQNAVLVRAINHLKQFLSEK